MKKFMILIHGDDEQFADMSEEEASAIISSLNSFESQLKSENALLATHRLHPASTAKLVRLKRKNGRTFLDGPFTETKEQLGGYYLLQAENMDTALKWLELIPASMDSTLEVREVVDEERSFP